MSANSDRRYSLILGVSVRNVFNNVNLSNPSGILGSPFFDTANALQGGPFSSGAANRRLDLQATFSILSAHPEDSIRLSGEKRRMNPLWASRGIQLVSPAHGIVIRGGCVNQRQVELFPQLRVAIFQTIYRFQSFAESEIRLRFATLVKLARFRPFPINEWSFGVCTKWLTADGLGAAFHHVRQFLLDSQQAFVP